MDLEGDAAPLCVVWWSDDVPPDGLAAPGVQLRRATRGHNPAQVASLAADLYVVASQSQADALRVARADAAIAVSSSGAPAVAADLLARVRGTAGAPPAIARAGVGETAARLAREG